MLSAVASAFLLAGIIIIFGSPEVWILKPSPRVSSLWRPDTWSVCARPSSFWVRPQGGSGSVPCLLPDATPQRQRHFRRSFGLLIKSREFMPSPVFFLNVFGLTPALSTVLMYLGVISMVVAALLALGQTDIKRMLAYSSISQVGYIVLGIGLATPLGILGGLFHLFNHALAKSLLFLDSGSLQMSTGTRNLDEMGGLGRGCR